MLKQVHTYKVELELLSGMHITGSDDSFDIGGADSQVIKNPLSGEPYIPGSSLKGKLRSLLEYKYGEVDNSGKEPDYKILDAVNKACLQLFQPSDELSPNITRGIFRDLTFTQETKEQLKIILGDNTYTEIKAENSIDRFKGTAKSPRFIERVPAGCKFEGQINILEFEGDNFTQLDAYLKEAINLLNYNFIGGSGSRGYGRVDVKITEVKEG